MELQDALVLGSEAPQRAMCRFPITGDWLGLVYQTTQ